MSKFTRRIAAIGVGIILAGGAGVAYALWTANGTGTAQAGTTTLKAVTVTPGPVANTLFPDGTAVLNITVTNPNAFAVAVELTLKDATSNKAGCNGSNISLTSTPLVVPSVPASATNALMALPNAVKLSATAPNECQGAVFDLKLDTVTKR